MIKKLLIFIGSLYFSYDLCTQTVRKAHLKDWYPTERHALRKMLNECELQARTCYNADNLTGVRAVIVPHAGYQYSGAVAASAIRLFDAKIITNIIILAPSHRYISGNACAYVTPENFYALPTGNVTLDTKTAQQLVAKKSTIVWGTTLRTSNPFNIEHSMEIELPLLHHYLPNVSVLPILINPHITSEQIRALAKSLAPYINETTVVVVSSDFIHYGNNYNFFPFKNDSDIFHNLRALTHQTLQPIFNQSLHAFKNVLEASQANVCGQAPMSVLLALLEQNAFGKQKLESHLVAYATSHDDTLPVDSCVTYVSLAFTPATSHIVLTSYEQRSLQEFLHHVIKSKANGTIPQSIHQPIISDNLKKHAGTFVTLTDKKKNLRGCIGTIFPTQELWKVLQKNALQAAFKDTRFTPVTPQEVNDLTITCSLLSQPQKAILEELRVGDGIIVTLNNHTALFLPEVGIEQGWNKEQLLSHLSLKAGLSADAWKDKAARFEKFSSYVF